MHIQPKSKEDEIHFYKCTSLELVDPQNYYLVWVDQSDVTCPLNFEQIQIKKNTLVILNPNDILICKSNKKVFYKVINLKEFSNLILKLLRSTRLFKDSKKASIIDLDEIEASNIKNYFNDAENKMTKEHINEILLKKLMVLGMKKPSELIKDHLLLEVKKLLIFSDKSVWKVCFEMGFDSPAYFARFFKKNRDYGPKF